MISFTSIPFVVVKLKNFVRIQHSCWVHFGGVFCLFLLNMWSNFGQTLTPMLPPKYGRNRKKNSCPKKKLIIRISKYIKTKSLLPFLAKLGYFLHF